MAADDYDGHRLSYRAFVRGSVSIPARIREQGSGPHMVEVIDLSQSGFRMRSVSFLSAEKSLYLTLPDYSPLKARIIWQNDEEYGCEFHQRLHEAIYDDIIKRYPQWGAKSYKL